MATAKASKTATRAAASNAPAVAPMVRVVGQGTLLEGGLPFLLVSSASELGRAHVVVYRYEGCFVGSRAQCDCMAAQFGKACKHVLVAREWLHMTTPAAERARGTTPRKKQPARPVAPDAAGCDRQRDHPGDTAMMARSQKPFSLLAK